MLEQSTRYEQDDDVLRKLLSPGVKLILIKGAPGTGKTSLAMRLLEYAESGVYISSRVGLEKLAEQNPRLIQMPESGSLQEVRLESEKTDYEDARLGKARMALDQIIKATMAKKDLIILDSWDTMAKEMERTERLKMEKTIAAVVDAGSSKLAFISEEPELTSTDYLADAIVTLTRSDFEGRRLREISWEKLRGQSAADRRSLFTLQDGRFALLGGPDARVQELLGRTVKVIPNTATHISTGSRDLDEFLGGGFVRGMTVLLEDGSTVGNDWHRPLYIAMRANFILSGGGCLTVPSIPVSPRSIVESTEALVGEELTRSKLRVISFPATNFKHPSIVDASMMDYHATYELQMRTANEISGGSSPVLWILSIDTYETYAGADKSSVAGYFARGTAANREFGSISFLLAKPSSVSLQVISDNCDIHLKLEEKDGALMFYSKRPPSDLYTLNYDYGAGYPQARLRKMV